MEFESFEDSVLEQAKNGRQLLADAKESIDEEEQEASLKIRKLQQREQEIKAIKWSGTA